MSEQCELCHEQLAVFTLALKLKQKTEDGVRTITVERDLCLKCYGELMEGVFCAKEKDDD